MRKQLATAAAGFAMLAGTPVLAACASQPSQNVASAKVASQETRWVQQGNSDQWVLWYLLLLNNGQSMRVTQNYWNAAVPGQTNVYYNATSTGAVADPDAAESASDEQDDEGIEEEDTASEDDQSYDEQTEEESGISDDDEEDFSEDEDDESDDDGGDDGDAFIIPVGGQQLHVSLTWSAV